MDYFTAKQVTDVTQVSERNLHYWDSTGVIFPTKAANGAGRYRRYTREDVICVSLVKRMRDADISLQKIRKHALDIRHAVRQAAREGTVPLFLIEHKRRPLIVIRDPEKPKEVKQFIDTLKGCQLVLAFDLAPIAEDVERSLMTAGSRRTR